jgi:hypothetical protein
MRKQVEGNLALKGLSRQMLDYILDSGKLNQYFLQDCFWLNFFLLRVPEMLKK